MEHINQDTVCSLSWKFWREKSQLEGILFVEIQHIKIIDVRKGEETKAAFEGLLEMSIGEQRYQQNIIPCKEELNFYTTENKILIFDREHEETMTFIIKEDLLTRQKNKEQFENKQSLSQNKKQTKSKRVSAQFQPKKMQTKQDQSLSDRYGQVTITPFIKLEDADHFVNIHLIERTVEKKIIEESQTDKKTGNIYIKICYLPKSSLSNFNCTLSIIPIKGNLTNSPSGVGKMQPRVKFTLGNKQLQSRTSKEEGLRPVWDQEVFEFPVISPMQYLKIEVIDRILNIPVLVGFCILDWRILVQTKMQQPKLQINPDSQQNSNQKQLLQFTPTSKKENQHQTPMKLLKADKTPQTQRKVQTGKKQNNQEQFIKKQEQLKQPEQGRQRQKEGKEEYSPNKQHREKKSTPKKYLQKQEKQKQSKLGYRKVKVQLKYESSKDEQKDAGILELKLKFTMTKKF